jgi:uncharacterized protein
LKIKLIGKIIAISFFIPLSASPASFNCSKVSTQVERLICSNADLSAADDQMVSLYKKGKKLNNKITVQQRRWLKERNACADVKCLSDSYLQRLEELSGSYQPKAGGKAFVKPLPDSKTVKPITKELVDNISVRVFSKKHALLKYQLKHGSYVRKAHVDTTHRRKLPDTTVAISMIAFGDLNGDKVDDAAVIISNNTGVNAATYSLTGILAKAGRPLATPPVDLGVTISFGKFKVDSGKIVLSGLFLDGNALSCCSPQKVTYIFRVKKGALVALR